MVGLVSSVGASAPLPSALSTTSAPAARPASAGSDAPAKELRVAQVSIRGPLQATWVDLDPMGPRDQTPLAGGFIRQDGQGDLLAGEVSQNKAGTAYAMELIGVIADSNQTGANEPQQTALPTGPQTGVNIVV